MPSYALLSDNKVINIIVADSLEVASSFGKAVEYTEENPAFIGAIYDKEANTFTL